MILIYSLIFLFWLTQLSLLGFLLLLRFERINKVRAFSFSRNKLDTLVDDLNIIFSHFYEVYNPRTFIENTLIKNKNIKVSDRSVSKYLKNLSKSTN